MSPVLCPAVSSCRLQNRSYLVLAEYYIRVKGCFLTSYFLVSRERVVYGMDRSTGEPRPHKSFGFLTTNLSPWVRYGATSQSLLPSPAAAMGLTTALAEQHSQCSGSDLEGMSLAGSLSPYTAQL